jgi:hypothetical protein
MPCAGAGKRMADKIQEVQESAGIEVKGSEV